jgi:hypothetical protein
MARAQVRVYVDPDLRLEWEAVAKKKLGNYATLAWLMEVAMRSTLDLMAESEDNTELVKASIKSHIQRSHFQPNHAT